MIGEVGSGDAAVIVALITTGGAILGTLIPMFRRGKRVEKKIGNGPDTVTQLAARIEGKLGALRDANDYQHRQTSVALEALGSHVETLSGDLRDIAHRFRSHLTESDNTTEEVMRRLAALETQETP